MLISDSMGLLWLGYAVLSVLVLITGYLALGFLPRLPRLVISWAVAGLMWMPASYSLPLLEQGESYHGMAPAAVVAALAFLEGDRSLFTSTLFLLVVAAAAGGACGLLLWWLGRGRAEARRQARLKRDGRRGDCDSDSGDSGDDDSGATPQGAAAVGTTLAAIPEDRPGAGGSVRPRRLHSRMSDRQEPTLG
ncbi:MAG: hypothetical protein ACTH3D_11920 [Halomonas sp.]|uniref:hypothetical protein n=1 Tax=Halomonas sp. TaxID=1486246 RepID=UPI003F92D46F